MEPPVQKVDLGTPARAADGTEHLAFIDALRGWAFLAVLVVHLHKRDRNPVGAFFVRRLFRIAPLFWLAIPFYLWLKGLAPRPSAPYGIHWPQIVSTIFFLHGWHPTSINSVVPGGWSIAVEMNFYLLLPLCFMYLNSLRRCMIAGAGAVFFSVAVSWLAGKWLMRSYTAYPADLIQSFMYYWLPRQMPVKLTTAPTSVRPAESRAISLATSKSPS